MQMYFMFFSCVRILIMQECAAGDVHKLLGTCGGYLPEPAALQQVMRPSVSAIAYLHAQASPHNALCGI